MENLGADPDASLDHYLTPRQITITVSLSLSLSRWIYNPPISRIRICNPLERSKPINDFKY